MPFLAIQSRRDTYKWLHSAYSWFSETSKCTHSLIEEYADKFANNRGISSMLAILSQKVSTIVSYVVRYSAVKQAQTRGQDYSV